MARWLLVLAALLAAEARAETYPAKPVQVIVQFNPGATADVIGRVMAEELRQRLGQQFVIVNREGASGIIALNAVAQARPDGYTLALSVAGGLTAQPHMMKNASYTLESFAPICQMFETQFIVIVGPSSPYATLGDIIAFARANPGKLSYGVFGIGSIPHLQFHSLLMPGKVEMTPVPYKNAAQMATETSTGQIDVSVSSIGSLGSAPLRIVAVLAAQRNDTIPDVPSTGELGYPVSDPNFSGLIAPKGTPPEVLKTLEAACAAVSQTPRVQEVLQRTGSTPAYLDAAGYEKHLRADFQAKGELIRAMNLKSE